MASDAGGWLWFLIDVILVVIFAGALFYGMSMWRKRRSGAVEAVRDEATKDLYRRDPESKGPDTARPSETPPR